MNRENHHSQANGASSPLTTQRTPSSPLADRSNRDPITPAPGARITKKLPSPCISSSPTLLQASTKSSRSSITVVRHSPTSSSSDSKLVSLSHQEVGCQTDPVVGEAGCSCTTRSQLAESTAAPPPPPPPPVAPAQTPSTPSNSQATQHNLLFASIRSAPRNLKRVIADDSSPDETPCRLVTAPSSPMSPIKPSTRISEKVTTSATELPSEEISEKFSKLLPTLPQRDLLVQVHWRALSVEKLENTVWKELEKDKESWEKSLEETGVFEEATKNFKMPKYLKIGEKKNLNTGLQSVFGDKVGQIGQALEIILKPFGGYKGVEVLRLKISRCEVSGTLLDDLNRTFSNLTDVQKTGLMKNLSSSSEEISLLNVVDQSLVSLLRIPRLEGRLSALIYKRDFEENTTVLELKAKLVLEASHAVLKTPMFASLLSLTLTLGNFFNSSNSKLPAQGFNIEGINKLFTLKPPKSGPHSVLHLIAKTVSRSRPDIEGFLQELEPTLSASNVDWTYQKMTFASLLKNQVLLEKELKKQGHAQQQGKQDVNDNFVRTFGGFAISSGEKLEELQKVFDLADSTFLRAIKYYGSDISTVSKENIEASQRFYGRGSTEVDFKIPTVEEFFRIFYEFVGSYKKCLEDNGVQSKIGPPQPTQSASSGPSENSSENGSPISNEVSQCLPKRSRDSILSSTPRFKERRRLRHAIQSTSALRGHSSPRLSSNSFTSMIDQAPSADIFKRATLMLEKLKVAP